MKRGLVLFAAAVVTVVVWAGPKKSAKGGMGPTRMVTLNVAAEDAQGQPVEDLTESDFQVWDKGKAQSITLFRHNTETPEKLVERLGPHQFSNRTGEVPPHVTLILFDLLNERMGQQGYARSQIIETLSKLESANYLYFYLLTVEGLLPVHGLPEPNEEPAPKPETPWTRGIQPILDAALNNVFRMRPYMYTDDRVMMTFNVLEDLATRLGAVAGRKNIVWITHGVPIAIGPARSGIDIPIDYEPVLRELNAALDRAQVAVYPVDLAPPGMEGPMSATSSGPGGMGRGGMGSRSSADSGGIPESSQTAPGVASADTLEEMAAMTGGKAFVNPDIPGAIHQALKDARSSYVIGYYPPPANWDGKLHKIKLKCARKGVRLVAKTEYMAYPPEAAGMQAEQAAMRAAMLSPFDASEIGLVAEATPDATTPAKTHLRLRIRAQDVSLLPVGDRFTGELALTYVMYGPDGRPQASEPMPLRMDLTQQQRDDVLKNGITAGGDLEFGPQVHKVRVVVFDNNSSAVGSVTLTGLGRPASG
jgi:VWFA-related protein